MDGVLGLSGNDNEVLKVLLPLVLACVRGVANDGIQSDMDKGRLKVRKGH